MKIIYCRGYSLAKNVLIKPWTAAKTKKAHERRRHCAAVLYGGVPYTYTTAEPDESYVGQEFLYVQLPDLSVPLASIAFNRDNISVSFLDERLREDLCYSCQEEEPSRVFISMVVAREFEGQTNNLIDARVFLYGMDGSVTIQRGGKDQDFKVDVSPNWKPYPEFGQYSDLLLTKFADF